MRLLLDTHVFLWFLTADRRLPGAFNEAIQDTSNAAYLSVASIWECVIKHQIGKLPLPTPPAEYLPKQRQAHAIESLPIDEGAMANLASLPSHHRDPFDRLIVAQALQHNLVIVTVDPVMRSYPARLLKVD